MAKSPIQGRMDEIMLQMGNPSGKIVLNDLYMESVIQIIDPVKNNVMK